MVTFYKELRQLCLVFNTQGICKTYCRGCGSIMDRSNIRKVLCTVHVDSHLVDSTSCRSLEIVRPGCPETLAGEGNGVHASEAKVDSTFIFVPFRSLELFALAVGLSSAVCHISLCEDQV
jgi:hypothetical protein